MNADSIDECYPRRVANLASRVLRGQAIVMNPVDSGLFGLNETATVIWEAADGRTTLREIVEREICPQFEIDPATALRDADELVRSLAAQNILIVAEEPASE
jgi:hypothetical protein